jgi:hypothetical protein
MCLQKKQDFSFPAIIKFRAKRSDDVSFSRVCCFQVNEILTSENFFACDAPNTNSSDVKTIPDSLPTRLRGKSMVYPEEEKTAKEGYTNKKTPSTVFYRELLYKF